MPILSKKAIFSTEWRRYVADFNEDLKNKITLEW